MMLTEAGKQLHDGLQSIERQLRLLKTDVAAVSDRAVRRSRVRHSAVAARADRRTAGQSNSTRPIRASWCASSRRPAASCAISSPTGCSMSPSPIRCEPTHGIASQQLGRERMLLVGPARRQAVDAEGNADHGAGRTPADPDHASEQPAADGRKRAWACTACSPASGVEANTLPLMTDLVIAGLGYTVLPACGVRDLVQAGLVSASPIADLFITWLVARPRTRRPQRRGRTVPRHALWI